MIRSSQPQHSQGNCIFRYPAWKSPKNLQKHPWKYESARPKEHSMVPFPDLQSRNNFPISFTSPSSHHTFDPGRSRNSSYWVREEKKSEGKREEIDHISLLKAGGHLLPGLAGEQWGRVLLVNDVWGVN